MPNGFVKASIENDGKDIPVVLMEKEFRTGSRGFHAQGKVVLDKTRYQLNFMLVEIGSKPKPG